MPSVTKNRIGLIISLSLPKTWKSEIVKFLLDGYVTVDG